MYKIDKKDREQVIIIINDYIHTFLYERAMANGKEVHIYGNEGKKII